LSKRLLMFYESFDLIRLITVLCTHPESILVWVTNLGIGKWLLIVILVAL
jgi:hypothetical protein